MNGLEKNQPWLDKSFKLHFQKIARNAIKQPTLLTIWLVNFMTMFDQVEFISLVSNLCIKQELVENNIHDRLNFYLMLKMH